MGSKVLVALSIKQGTSSLSIRALEECLSIQALSSPDLLPESVIPAGHTRWMYSPSLLRQNERVGNLWAESR